MLGRARPHSPSAGSACPAGPPCRSRSSTPSLLVALLGMYWDISLHIDNGRDPGPLANPAHYLILVGLFGIFAAGFIAIALPRGAARPDGRPHHARTGTRRSAAC